MADPAQQTDVVLEVEGLSKQYPGTPVQLYPPIVSMFDRRPFRRKRSSANGAHAPAARGRERDLEEDVDEDFDDDDELDEDLPALPVRPGPLWALKDISFRLHPGEGVGVLGGPGAGKTTLLRILGGGAAPTEGRILIRDPVVPTTGSLARALAFTSRGNFKFDLVLGCRMLGIKASVAKSHRDEIHELARPELGPDGEPEPKGIAKLAIATGIVLPGTVMLLDIRPGMDDGFKARVAERVRQRLAGGTSLVLASREPELVSQLCDETIWLEEGTIVQRGGSKRVVRRYQVGEDETGGPRRVGGKAWERLSSSQDLLRGKRLRVPEVVPAFTGAAALVSAQVHTRSGRLKRVDASDEVAVEIRLETALRGVELQCGVAFRPRDSEAEAVRLELPEPVRFSDAGAYLLVARAPPGSLPSGTYDMSAEAVVAAPGERAATVIARDIGSVRVVSDAQGAEQLVEWPGPDWDGGVSFRVEADWSIE